LQAHAIPPAAHEPEDAGAGRPATNSVPEPSVPACRRSIFSSNFAIALKTPASHAAAMALPALFTHSGRVKNRLGRR